jgi:tetratricopeptide (TPR) repeat protein
MKKIITLFCFIACIQVAFSQTKYVDSLKNVLSATNKPIEQFDLLNKINESFFEDGDANLDSASIYRMLLIAQRLNNDSLLTISYNTIGNIYFFNTGDYSKALEYFFKGVPLAEKINDKRRLSSLYSDISQVFENIGNFDEQIMYIKKAEMALPDKASAMYDFMLVQVQINYASYFINRRQPDSSLHYIQRLNETNQRLKGKIFESISLTLSAKAYQQRGDVELASAFFNKALAVTDSISNPYNQLSVRQAYTNFLLAGNKIENARNQAFKLMQAGQQLNNNDYKLAAAGFLKRVYDTLQNKDSAYYYLQLQYAFRDSVFSREKTNKIQSLEFSEQIRITEEEVKRIKQEEQRRQNIQYVLIAMGIITFIILFLVLSHSIIINTKLIRFFGVIALLIVFEFLNLLLHPFLERITHHSPVLMLLALVCIAALLVPLHHKLEKWATHKLVEKNKQIRLASAKKTIEELEKK